MEISKKKGTFDLNLVFTATLACTKRAIFITKKGTFSPLKKIGVGARAPRASPVPTTLRIKALLHGAIFHATCLVMAFRNKLHESLHRLTCPAMAKIFARQVA